MKLLFLTISLVISEIAVAQIKFPENPTVRVVGDSSYFEVNSGQFYSYFFQEFDSIFISFEPVKFYQVAVINNETHNGYFSIKYQNKVLIYYEIKDDKIEGLAYMFHPDLMGNIYNLPYCQAIFTDNRLNGVLSFYNDETGIIEEVILYKKGKYKKYLYHYLAQNGTDLVRGNKFARDPFKYREHVR